MPQSWYEDRVRQLLGGLKALEQSDEEAEAARRDAEANLEKIKSGTRLKDRYLWLSVWANGDRSVYDRIKPLRDEIKLRKQQTADIPRRHRTMLDELDDIITDDLGQNDPEFQTLLSDQRELRRKRDTCDYALRTISATRRNITSMSSSMPISPKGKELATAEKKTGEISAQIRVVHGKVVEVNGIAGSYGSVSGALVKKLDPSFLTGEFRYQQRKDGLNTVLRTLGEVDRKVSAISDKIEKRLRELDSRRAQLVKAKRDRLLSTHGIKAT
jgi:chromosome segregation ATPase